MAVLLHSSGFHAPCIAAAALGCLLASAMASSAGAQEAAACTVARLRGTAAVLRDGGSARLTAGAPLRGDDQIVTGARTRLRIACSNGVEITIGPDSSVALRAVAAAGTDSRSLLE